MTRSTHTWVRRWLGKWGAPLAAALALAACGGGGSSAPTSYSLAGAVSGLATGQTLTLQNTTGEALTVGVNGAFAFATPLVPNAAYAVTVKTQPEFQVCTVANGTGQATGQGTRVAVTCVTPVYAVGGTVSGLASGKSVVLHNFAGEHLTVRANGSFEFATRITAGWSFAVEVQSQPAGQTCTVANGAGTIRGNLTDVQVVCASSTYAVGGFVTGLANNATLVLQNNGAGDVTVSSNGSFRFSTPAATGTAYAVTVKTQPAGQTCTVNNAQGTVTGHEIGVNVSCVNASASVAHTIGGTVSGLGLGSSVLLQNNGADDLRITSNGSFSFATPVVAGKHYAVTVRTQPVGHSCLVAQGSGTANAAVSHVTVTCTANTANTYSVGGTVTGLRNDSLTLTLANWSTGQQEQLTLAQSANFTFTHRPSNGHSLYLYISSYPAGHFCAVDNSTAVVNGNVSSFAISCTPNRYTLSSWVNGLPWGTDAAVSLRLTSDAGPAQDLSLSSAQSWSPFPVDLPYGASYQVQIVSQPARYACTVKDASGVVKGWVSNIEVTCVPQKYKIGGDVNGLSSAGLSVKLSSTRYGTVVNETLAVPNGASAYQFLAALDYPASYTVSIAQQPAGNTCMLRNGAGAIDSANVSTVSIECFAPNNSGSTRYAVDRVELAQTLSLPDGSAYLKITPQRQVLVRAFVRKTAVTAAQPVVTLRAYSAAQKAWADVAVMTCPAITTTALIAPSYTLGETCYTRVNAGHMQADTILSVAAADASYVFAPPVIAPYKIALVVVPISIGGVVPAITDEDLGTLKTLIETRMPFAQATVTKRSVPFVATGSVSAGLQQDAEWSAVLTQLDQLRRNETTDTVFYYGFVSNVGTPAWGGMGYMPGNTAIGLYGSTYTANGLINDFRTFMHELGHNLSLPHAPCGTAGNPDPDYPYANGSLSTAPLVDAATSTLLDPSSLEKGADVMGYCSGTWFSDYHYAKMQTYMQSASNGSAIFGVGHVKTTPARAAGAALTSVLTQPKLMISGAIRAAGTVTLQPVQASTAQTYSPNVGGHHLKIYTARSAHPMQWAFEPQEVADAAQPEHHFHVVVPDVGASVTAIEVWRGTKLLHRIGANAAQQAAALAQGAKPPKGSASVSNNGTASIGTATLLSALEANGELRVKWDAANWPYLQAVHTDSAGKRLVLTLQAQGGDVRLPTQALRPGGTFDLSFSNGLGVTRLTIKR